MIHRGLRSGALAGALALALSFGILSPATAAPRDDYPSWDEVEAARGDRAATEAAIARIDALLSALEADAARLGDAAVSSTAAAQSARATLDAATAQADSLSRRADAAARRSAESAEQAAQVAAALYRSGGADVTTMLVLGGDGDLLSSLGTLDRVGGSLALALQRADTDRNQAAALDDQAEAARAARAAASSTADATAATALAAAKAADDAVAQQQAGLDLLYAQLAELKETTATLEQQYRAGQQAGNEPSSGGTDGGAIVVPGGEVNDVAAARAYAFGQLAASGLGSGEQDCLLWLWNRESGWRTNAYNSSSGAYGIPQALPGSKMAVMGADWRTSYVTQVNWGLAYISSRYGTPCGAWAHSESIGWY